MKILQLCHKSPYPPVDGGCLAMKEMAEMMLAQGNELHILSISTTKHPAKLNAVPKNIRYYSIPIDTSLHIGKAFTNLFGTGSYNIERFYSKRFEDKLAQLLKEENYDLVLLESLFVSPYLAAIKQHSKAKIIYRAHNVEYKLWEQFAASASFPKSAYLSFLAKRMKKQELQSICEIDALLCISKADEEILKRPNIPHELVPMTYPIDEAAIEKPFQASFFQLAAMDWFPNEEAVDWFINDIWPLLSEANNKACVHLAGREMPERFLKISNDHLKINSEISNKQNFYAKHDIMIVPLLSGSGVRVKIIEGLALGKTIITTSIGASGIDCTHGENILIADTAKEFSDLMLRCLSDLKWAKAIGNNGLALAKKEFSRAEIGEKLMRFYKKYGV